MANATAIAAARALATTSDREREVAVAAASLPSVGDEPCPLAASELIPLDDPLVRRASTTIRMLGQTQVVMLGNTAKASPLAARALDNILAGEDVSEEALDRFATGHDLVLVVNRLVKPSRASEHSFRSGMLVGTLYTWNRAERRFDCGATLANVSSDEVEARAIGPDTKPDVDGALIGNLVVPALIDSAKRLKRLVPNEQLPARHLRPSTATTR